MRSESKGWRGPDLKKAIDRVKGVARPWCRNLCVDRERRRNSGKKFIPTIYS
jgi:hypothetical protein